MCRYKQYHIRSVYDFSVVINKDKKIGTLRFGDGPKVVVEGTHI